ncbi:MAG: iron-containing alcohol dehydrogenase [Polyangiales bacterium]|nr:iron-containing alcohol dehydrogenase [Myxococcales bacterium]
MIQYWHFPTRTLFGEGALQSLTVEVAALGASRALVVTQKDVVGAGVVDRVLERVRSANVETTVFDAVVMNPKEKTVLEASLLAREAKVDLLIAVGGGSAMDVAKLASLLAQNPPPLEAYATGSLEVRAIQGPLPPVIAIPTTAGSGAEVSDGAIITLEATGRKGVVRAPELMPRVAVVDPALATSLSPRLTAETGFEALSHAIEAYLAKGDHPMADAIALQSLELIAAHFERAVEDGSNASDRSALAKAATMGAVAAQKGLGVCHSLAHGLMVEHGLGYGLALSVCLPAALDFNRTAVPERVARVAKLLGARGSDTETLAFECAGAVRALRRRVGLPGGLRAVGVEDPDFERLANLAHADDFHPMNPRVTTVDDLVALFRASA